MQTKSVRIRTTTLEEISRVADERRMSIVETVDALSCGWRLMSAKQREQAIRSGVARPSTK